VKLWPDGSVTPGNQPGDNTLWLGHGQAHGTVRSWTLPALPAEDAELCISCEIRFNDYFSAFDGQRNDGRWREAHGGFMLRSVLEDLPLGQYKGHGPIFGRVWRPENNPNGLPPGAYGTAPPGARMQLESWGVGIVPPEFEYLRLRSHSPVLEDGRLYKLFASSKRFQGEVFSRYAIKVLNAHAQFELLFDTGDVQDNNWGLDRWRESLTLFDAAGTDNRHLYSIQISNLAAVQRAAHCVLTDMRHMPWVRP
jgi:hypothetical protein